MRLEIEIDFQASDISTICFMPHGISARKNHTKIITVSKMIFFQAIHFWAIAAAIAMSHPQISHIPTKLTFWLSGITTFIILQSPAVLKNPRNIPVNPRNHSIQRRVKQRVQRIHKSRRSEVTLIENATQIHSPISQKIRARFDKLLRDSFWNITQNTPIRPIMLTERRP